MRSNLSSHAPRKAHIGALGLCALLASALTMALLPGTAVAANAEVYVIDAVDGCPHHCFTPENVTINNGESVTWISVSGEEHDILRCTLGPCPHNGGTGTGAFREIVLEPSEVEGQTLTGPGTYNYYCQIHGYEDMHGSVTVAGEPEPSGPPPAGDFDGDAKSDVGVYRPSTGAWFVDASGGTDLALGWGTSGDLIVPGDYDGDGDVEAAVYRPSTGVWFVNGGPTVAFGIPGDIPVPGDYDGDGDTDIAVFRPSNGIWFVNGGPIAAFGAEGDIPVPGDYDGDGDTDFAVFRPSNGIWFINGGPIASFGIAGDIPVPGDYDGDGDTDIAVFRPSNGYWFVHGGAMTPWGTAGDVPIGLPTAIRQVYFP